MRRATLAHSPAHKKLTIFFEKHCSAQQLSQFSRRNSIFEGCHTEWLSDNYVEFRASFVCDGFSTWRHERATSTKCSQANFLAVKVMTSWTNLNYYSLTNIEMDAQMHWANLCQGAHTKIVDPSGAKNLPCTRSFVHCEFLAMAEHSHSTTMSPLLGSKTASQWQWLAFQYLRK